MTSVEQSLNQELHFVCTNLDIIGINDATDSSFHLMLLKNFQKQYTFKIRYSRLNCELLGDEVHGDTSWYWVSIGWQWLVLGGTGSI